MDAPGAAVVVVAAQLCAPVPGGTGRYVRELLGALAGCAPAGASLRAALPRGCVPRAGLPVDIVPLPLPTRVLARLWERGLPPALGRGSVVHAPTLMVPPVTAALGLVVTIHDVVPWTHPETLTPHGARYHQRVGARAAREADVLVTHTHAVAAQIRDVLRPACPVVAVHPGVAARPVPADAPRRSQCHRRSRRPYLLFVGTAEPRKGLDTLVAALAHADLADYDLVVAGPAGWGNVRVPDLAAAAGVSARVHVTGRVSEEDLVALYVEAAALAMPSRAEGFGFPVAEAMAYGTPVVTSTDPALVEVGGEAAVAVSIDDPQALAEALARVAAEGPERRRRTALGRGLARSFDWATTAERMWALYSSVAAEGRPSG